MLLVFRVIGVTPGAGRGANILNSLFWDACNVLDRAERLGVVIPEGPDPFAYWGVPFFALIMRYWRRWGHRYRAARGVVGGKGFLVGAEHKTKSIQLESQSDVDGADKVTRWSWTRDWRSSPGIAAFWLAGSATWQGGTYDYRYNSHSTSWPQRNQSVQGVGVPSYREIFDRLEIGVNLHGSGS